MPAAFRSDDMRLLRRTELKSLKGIPWSDMHLGRLEKRGEFPRRVRLGANTVGWLESEIDAFLAAKAAEREEAA
jgi:prophage regulatory protein